MTDTQLLDQFVAGQDDDSFRALMLRHGPMVLGVCRRMLDDPHDVDDAFQATFVVLMRRAAGLREPETLHHWLNGVARRVAIRTRRGQARRRVHEKRGAELRQPHAVPEFTDADLTRLVREELARLPGPYRTPLELCYLSGLSHEDAAAELGWPLGTLKTRLVRGRRRLRDRLDRRGVALGLGLLFLLNRRSMAVCEGVGGEPTKAIVAKQAQDSAMVGATTDPSRGLWSILGFEVVRPWTRLAVLVALLVAILATSQGITYRSRVKAAEFEAFAALPPSLTDVLNVACR